MSIEFELHPRLAQDSLAVLDWPLCQLRLINDCQYPWFILVPRRPELRELHELSPADHRQFWHESAALSRYLQQAFAAHKLNVAALGNVVPQLHVHHIARFEHDPAWPAPVWGHQAAKPYAEADAAQRIAAAKRQLVQLAPLGSDPAGP